MTSLILPLGLCDFNPGPFSWYICVCIYASSFLETEQCVSKNVTTLSCLPFFLDSPAFFYVSFSLFP